MRSAIASASSADRAMPFSGWRRPRRCSSCWKRSRSSAMSIASAEVPRIGMPGRDSAWDSFSGVWPPILDDAAEQRAVLLFRADQRDDVLARSAARNTGGRRCRNRC